MSGVNSSVEDWLRSLGLITYTEAFIDNGYDELDICKEIGEEDLDAIGVANSRDRTDILNSVARLKQSGTAVYFVLEAGDTGNYLPPQVQPRERYDKLKLKMLLHEKLAAQKISLADSPYTNPVSQYCFVDFENLKTKTRFLHHLMCSCREVCLKSIFQLLVSPKWVVKNEHMALLVLYLSLYIHYCCNQL